MRIWISGGGGMMGSHLSGALVAAGHDVSASYYKPTVDPADLMDVPLEEVDIRDWCSVYDSLVRFRPDAVFHLAAQSYPAASWQRPIETLETNVIGTANVLEAVRRLGTNVRVVVAGSSAEYGSIDPERVPVAETAPLLPLHPYGVSKVATDLLAYQYWAGFGLDAVRVRIFNCTGPRKVGDALSDFVRRMVWLERYPHASVIRVGNLEARRTIVDVRDLNRGLILLLERGKSGDVYNLGGSTAYSMSVILSRVLERATRSDIVPEVDPKLLRPTDEPIIWADCTKIKAATGWEPAISLDQTIDDMLSYWRQKPDRALVV
jgi:GDP-4-dehydro-6-deoxy-D-mannose reductase